MGTEIVIVLGLGVLSAHFAFFAFEFINKGSNENGNEQEQDHGIPWGKVLGVLFFLLSIIFIQMIMYSLVLIAQNTGLSYLNDTLLVTGLQIIMWSTIIVIGIYLFSLLLGILVWSYEFVSGAVKGRRKGGSA